MNNKYFNIKDTIYDITEKYREATELLISLGFENLKNDMMRKSFGKTISLETVLNMKKINIDTFVEQLIDKIENKDKDLNEVSLEDNIENNSTNNSNEKVIKIAGMLPCPVKVPLGEAFDNFLKNNEKNFDFKLECNFKAASMGLDWLKDILNNNSKEEIPDLFISAGFDLFFDKKLFGKYKSQDLFEDITGINEYNKDVNNDYIQLKDPKNQYSMVGMVAAIFLVNTEELNGRKAPTTWKELLSDEFEKSVSLPIADFDLFNSILLNIHKNYGDYGVRRLGKILKRSMHPSEMVKSHIKANDKPAVTIMPYFFTKMVTGNGPMTPVWPKDGAIISPIFMLSKKDKKDELKPIVDFFASKEVGEILSHNGRFPSVNPEVDNMLTDNQKLMWLGWDYIESNDMSEVIKEKRAIFENAIKGEE